MFGMKKAEAEQAMDTLIFKWAEATSQPMRPDGKYHYSFLSFYNWVRDNHRSYTEFRADPNARDVMEMWFDDRMRQAWRN